MKAKVEAWLRAWFEKHHGLGEAHQAEVYRCSSCGRLVTWKKIRAADLCCTGRLIPSSPTFWQVIRLFVFPWSI